LRSGGIPLYWAGSTLSGRTLSGRTLPAICTFLLLPLGSPFGGLAEKIIEIVAHGYSLWLLLSTLTLGGRRTGRAGTSNALAHFGIGGDVS